MAIENLIPPPAYSISGLLRALDDPLVESYETQIAATMQHHGIDSFFNPGHKYSRAIALPNDKLIRALGATESGQSGANLTVGGLAEVARAARPNLVLDALGVPRREVGGMAGLHFPITQAFNVGSWHGEFAEGSELNPTIKSVVANPKEARAWVQYTRELYLQAGKDQLDQDILGMLSDAARATIEHGFLQGTGSVAQPHGLISRQAKGSQVFANPTPTRLELLSMLGKYAEAGGRLDRAAWIISNDMAVDLMSTSTGSMESRYLLDPGYGEGILGRPVGITDHAPDGTILLFDPTTCRTVYWGAPFALLDRFSDGLDIRGEARMLLYNYCDVVALHPDQLIVGAAA